MKKILSLALLLLTGSLAGFTLSCDRMQAEVNKQASATTHAVSRVGISTELKLLRGQIEIYRRLHDGANPPSLQAMDTLPHLKYPDEYQYDPNTGVVSSATYPTI